MTKVLRLILAEQEPEKRACDLKPGECVGGASQQPEKGISGIGCRVKSPEDIVEMSKTLGRALANTARMYPWEIPVTEWTLDRKK